MIVRSALRTGAAVLMVLAASATRALADSPARGDALNGSFVLQGGSVKAHGFLRAAAAGNPLDQRVDIWMTPESGRAPIRQYTVEMTKLLHVIIVSDDFKQFLHVHPVLGADGHFTVDQIFPAPGLYHVYADGDPQGIGQQVFRFDLAVGGTAAGDRALSRTGPSVSAGPYRVTLSGTTLYVGSESQIAVHITRNGKPAADLHPFLGALAHAVFLNARDLTYLHVHPMPMGDMEMGDMEMKPLAESATSSPDMLLHVMLREPGTYKLWLQFRGGTSLYVAPFTITAK